MVFAEINEDLNLIIGGKTQQKPMKLGCHK